MIRESAEACSGAADRPPRVGVVGGGQLGRMLLEASIPIGIAARVLARTDSDAAALVAGDVVVGDWQDSTTLAELARGCDVVTFDHELVAQDQLVALERAGAAVRPTAAAMAMASDKLQQRALASEVGLRVVAHLAADNEVALRAAVDATGYPAVVKATRGGYDGRAVWWVHGPGDLDALMQSYTLGDPLLVEPALDISAELAVLVARRVDGDHVVYPVVQTEQCNGICVTVTAPAATTAALAHEAEAGAVALAEALDYVGVLAVEYFVIDGALYLNEIAPRPHNSGHYTIDACVTSQFENHLRAVLDWPLGDPSLITPAAVMANIIAASELPVRPASVQPPPGARIHVYGKEPRPGRKVGHVTVCGADRVLLHRSALWVAKQLTGSEHVPGSSTPTEVAP